MVERLSIKETTSRNWQYINIQCCFWTTFNAEPESFEGCMEKKRANPWAQICCKQLPMYHCSQCMLYGIVFVKFGSPCGMRLKENIAIRYLQHHLQNQCLFQGKQRLFCSHMAKFDNQKKTFPWTQRTPLKRQFVERTAAWFWSHWWMVPKTNHLFVCKKNANKSCSCPPVINPMRLHEREQIKFEDRFHTFWNRTFAIQTPLWFPNGTANRFEFWENLAEH